jgi:hypothetical protein
MGLIKTIQSARASPHCSIARYCANDRIKKQVSLVNLAFLSNKPLPSLAKGQLWKTDTGYIQIWHIGKRLIDYKMMKQPGQRAVRTQATGIDTLKEYLKTHKAVLVNASPA